MLFFSPKNKPATVRPAGGHITWPKKMGGGSKPRIWSVISHWLHLNTTGTTGTPLETPLGSLFKRLMKYWLPLDTLGTYLGKLLSWWSGRTTGYHWNTLGKSLGKLGSWYVKLVATGIPLEHPHWRILWNPDGVDLLVTTGIPSETPLGCGESVVPTTVC
jgi:hypothetical protein